MVVGRRRCIVKLVVEPKEASVEIHRSSGMMAPFARAASLYTPPSYSLRNSVSVTVDGHHLLKSCLVDQLLAWKLEHHFLRHPVNHPNTPGAHGFHTERSIPITRARPDETICWAG